MNKFLDYLFIGLLYSIMSISLAHACEYYVAPGQFDNHPAQWGKDSGPIVNGFIGVGNPGGGTYSLSQGVDLSHYNKIDYVELAKCGGRFAFIQLDQTFVAHFRGLASAGVLSIPYYFLKLPAPLRDASAFHDGMSQDEVSRLRQAYAAAGVSSANDFVGRVQSFAALSPGGVLTSRTLAGLSGRFVAVDVEQSPLGKTSSVQAKYFGRFYATSICSFVQTLKQKSEFEDVIPLLYTFPAIYGQYLQFAYPEENDCIEGMPVWIARTFPNGGEAQQDPKARKTIDQYVQRLCLVQGGNRCIVHQYTHRGIFLALGVISGGVPPHIDLDRFYDAHVLPDDVSAQYVRQEDAFHPH